MKGLFIAIAIGAMGGWYAALPADCPPAREQLVSHSMTIWSAELAEQSMDAELLAAVALSEDPEAATAVMHVVLNRARASGKSVLEVVATPEQFHGWGRGLDPRRQWRDNWARKRLQGLEALAWRVLRGEVEDPTGGATHFHAVGSWEPPWAIGTQWVTMGKTHFYGS